jgi:hypothetical protein
MAVASWMGQPAISAADGTCRRQDEDSTEGCSNDDQGIGTPSQSATIGRPFLYEYPQAAPAAGADILRMSRMSASHW